MERQSDLETTGEGLGGEGSHVVSASLACSFTGYRSLFAHCLSTLNDDATLNLNTSRKLLP